MVDVNMKITKKITYILELDNLEIDYITDIVEEHETNKGSAVDTFKKEFAHEMSQIKKDE